MGIAVLRRVEEIEADARSHGIEGLRAPFDQKVLDNVSAWRDRMNSGGTTPGEWR